MSGISEVKKLVVGIAGIAVLLLGILLIFGNLSGNLGFTANSQGYNDSQHVIDNVTSGTTSLAGKFPTVFILLGVLLILVVVFLVIKMFMGGKGKSTPFSA